MKNIDKLTLKEYNDLIVLLSVPPKNLDLVSIFELLNDDYTKMNAGEFQQKWNYIKNYHPTKIKIQKYYNINGVKAKATLDLTKIKAAQFIDYQSVLQSGSKLEDLISIFLIPAKKSFFGYKQLNYNDGYDLLKFRNDIYNSLTIVEAHSLADFFLGQSEKLLKVTLNYLTKKTLMEKAKELKKKDQI